MKTKKRCDRLTEEFMRTMVEQGVSLVYIAEWYQRSVELENMS